MASIHHSNQLIVWAHSAWERLSLTPPVNLRDITDFLGIRVVKETLTPGVYGTYCKVSETDAVCFIESALPWQEQRRVLAHEIGHHLLSKRELPVVEYQCSYDNKGSQLERDCDEFAKHLLMPEKHLREKSEIISVDGVVRVYALASAFDVDKEAMRKRLYELGMMRRRARYGLQAGNIS